MKQSLIILTSLATVAFSSSTTVNFINNTTTNELSSKSEPAQDPPSLLNNKFGYLNQDAWITNQSTLDNKYYSYDTSHADYLLSDGKTSARILFSVNDTGKLVYKKDAIIAEKDKADIENTKQEMIDHKKITATKDTSNKYSKSEYNTSYFTGDNNDWKYLQFSGIEKNIDISSQQSANKVKNSENLNEPSGLYYIAKTERTSGGIDSAVAHRLAKYFISKSSLQGQISDNLTNKIVNLIYNNNDIYKFINNSPLSSQNREYTLNLIFDKNNNLIKIYYYKWNNISFEINTSYSFHKIFNGTGSTDNNTSGVFNLINWSRYYNNWDNFTKAYPKILFTNNSQIKIGYPDGDKNISNLTINTQQINNTTPEYKKITIGDENVPMYDELISNTYNFYLENSYSNFLASANIWLHVCFWRDNQNIYYEVDFKENSDCSTISSYLFADFNSEWFS